MHQVHHPNSTITLYNCDTTTGQRSGILLGRDVERLKQRARKLKREKGLTHTEALDRVAQDAGFNHWHHVSDCHQHIKPAESALKEGCVLLIDRNDLDDLDLSDGVFVEDELLELAFHKTLYKKFIDFSDEDDPESRPLKLTTDESELEAKYKEWLIDESFGYIRVHESSAHWPFDKIWATVQERFFWFPFWIIYHGTVIDVYDLIATDASSRL